MELSSLAFAFCAALAVGGLAYVFLYPYLSGERRAASRQKAIAKPSEHRRAQAEKMSQASRREQVAQSLKELDAREKARHKVTLEQRIAQAGLDWDRRKFIIVSIMIGVGTCILCFLGTLNIWIALGGLFVGLFGLPRWLLAFLKGRRTAKFVDEFPNAIDVIVRGVKSGLPLNDCLRIISAEASEPVKSEFRHIIEAQSIGLTVAEACQKLYQRVPTTEANFFGIVVAIQSKTGGSLSESFSNLSKVLRERKKMKGKISAMSMEAKASAAIIGLLPFIVGGLISVSSPGYMNLLFTTEAGKVALAASGVWMFVGIMVMKKMISFDF